MANWDNLATAKVEAEMRAENERGQEDGYDAGEKRGRHHPDFSSKPYRDWTAYERGYMYGYAIWLDEVGLY